MSTTMTTTTTYGGLPRIPVTGAAGTATNDSAVMKRRDFVKPIGKFPPENATSTKHVQFALKPKDVFKNALDIATPTSPNNWSSNGAVHRLRRDVGGGSSVNSISSDQLVDKLKQTTDDNTNKSSGGGGVGGFDLVAKGKELLLKAQNNRDKLYPGLMLTLALSMIVVAIANKTASGLMVFILALIFVIMVILTLLLFRN